MKKFLSRESLEIMRKILSETTLGNGVLFALATIAHSIARPTASSITLLSCIIISGIGVLLWMVYIVLEYISDLEKEAGKFSKVILIAWTLMFNILILVGIAQIVFGISIGEFLGLILPSTTDIR